MSAQDPLRVVITGISSGIGRALAVRLAGQGAYVAGLDIDPDPETTRGVVEEIEAAGGQALVQVGSTTSAAAVDALADATAERWGGIDGWVNNAARILVRPFLELSDADWQELLDTNLLGYVRGARAAARHMVPAGAGVIVNIGSAVETLPPTQMSAYVAAKGGVSALTRALAVELGPFGITVNVIGPGATETPLNAATWTDDVRNTYRRRIPLGRIAEPDDIASAISLLLRPEARYVTGQVIMADGGLTLDGSVGHRPV